MWLVWLQMCQNGKNKKQIDDCNVRKCNVLLVIYYITTSVHLYIFLFFFFFCCVECCSTKIHEKRRYYGKKRKAIKITCDVTKKGTKWNEEQRRSLCCLIFSVVVLCWLVQNMSTININEWAHAEKWLTGRTRPVTETEDEAVSWCPVSDEWRSISCFHWEQESGTVVGEDGGDGWFDAAACRPGWMMSVFVWLQRTAGMERCCKIILHPFFCQIVVICQHLSWLLSDSKSNNWLSQ